MDALDSVPKGKFDKFKLPLEIEPASATPKSRLGGIQISASGDELLLSPASSVSSILYFPSSSSIPFNTLSNVGILEPAIKFCFVAFDEDFELRDIFDERDEELPEEDDELVLDPFDDLLDDPELEDDLDDCEPKKVSDFFATERGRVLDDVEDDLECEVEKFPETSSSFTVIFDVLCPSEVGLDLDGFKEGDDTRDPELLDDRDLLL